MKVAWWLGVCLVVPSLAEAACITIDSSGWTQDQKNARQAVAYSLAFQAGHDTVPTITGDQICFDDPTYDPSGVSSTLLNQITTTLAAQSSATSAFQQKVQSAETDLSTNQIQTMDLAQIDTVIAGLGFTTPQATFLKALVHYLVDKRVIGK